MPYCLIEHSHGVVLSLVGTKMASCCHESPIAVLPNTVYFMCFWLEHIACKRSVSSTPRWLRAATPPVPSNHCHQSQFVHMLSYAAWMGSTVWVTFVAGITMMRNLPRQTFGKLQVRSITSAVLVVENTIHSSPRFTLLSVVGISWSVSGSKCSKYSITINRSNNTLRCLQMTLENQY